MWSLNDLNFFSLKKKFLVNYTKMEKFKTGNNGGAYLEMFFWKCLYYNY